MPEENYNLFKIISYYVGYMTGLGKQIQVADLDTAVAKRQRNVKIEGRHISLISPFVPNCKFRAIFAIQSVD